MFLSATFPQRGMELPLLQAAFLVLLIVLPIISKKVEHNLELFFLAMAVTTLGGIWSPQLVEESLLHPLAVYQPGIGHVPVGITQVALAAGLVFYLLRHKLAAKADLLARPGVLARLIFALGLSSSDCGVRGFGGAPRLRQGAARL
jgi:predicted cation transporter